MRIKKNLNQSFFVLTAASGLIFSGCGNISNTNSYQVSTAGFIQTKDSTNSDTFSCGGPENVFPQNSSSSTLETQAFYTVCTQKNSDQTITLSIETSDIQDKSLCIFPATINSSGSAQWIANAKGQPLSECLSLEHASAYLLQGSIQVSGINASSDYFNAVYVVRIQDQTAMSNYLSSGMYSSCQISKHKSSVCPPPSYSFGILN